MTTGRWDTGERVVRREFLHGDVWIGFTTYVVSDDPELLAVYLPTGAEIAFPDWPFDEWEHPWRTAGVTHWQGHGKLMLHRPGDAYSVDLFWQGPDREFARWYINLQDPVRRYETGFDTLDHELDYLVSPEGEWTEKDAELFEQRIEEGRYDQALAASVRETGAAVRDMLTRGEHWWSQDWTRWSPPDHWSATTLPAGWDQVEPATPSAP